MPAEDLTDASLAHSDLCSQLGSSHLQRLHPLDDALSDFNRQQVELEIGVTLILSTPVFDIS